MEYSFSRGQSVKGTSVIHRLDPRLKLYSLLGYVILTLLAGNPILLAVSGGMFLLVYLLSGLSILGLLRSARSVLCLILVSWLLSLIWVDMSAAGLTLCRLVLITLMSVIFSRTTPPRDILDGLRTGFPISEGAAMSLVIAFDFLPQLGREMEDIRCAAVSRGSLIEDGNPLKRLKGYIPLLIPIFRKTLQHAGNLADAMDLRGYDSGKKRTRIEPMVFQRRDRIGLYVLILYVGGMIALMLLL